MTATPEPEVTTQEVITQKAILEDTTQEVTTPATTLEDTTPPGAFSATIMGGALGGAMVVVLGVVIMVIGAVLLLKKHLQSKKGREGRSKEDFEKYETGT